MMVTIHASQVTFIVDMSNETVVAGNGNYPAVYISGVNINGPSGLEMNDNGDGTWQLTIDLQPGDYTYKFRNGYYPNTWSGGWESVPSSCGEGQYNDRIVVTESNDIDLDLICFNRCKECER